MQSIRSTIILVSLRVFQFFQPVFQPLQLFCRKIFAFDGIDDCFQYVLANIIGRIHVIEVVVVFIFHKVVSETFEHFEQDGNSFGIVALA
jgi:hypothetical protein